MGKDLKGKELGVGLSQRPDGRYMARYKGKCVYAKTFKEVRKEYAKLTESVDAGSMSFSKKTLDAYFDHWSDSRLSKGEIRQSTYRNYCGIYKRSISPKLGKLQLRKITKADVKSLQEYIFTSKGSCYANSVLALLKNIMHSALDDDLIAKDPTRIKLCPSGDTKRAIDTIHRALTEEEVNLFMTELKARNNCNYCAISFLLATGVRTGEMRALKWSDISYKDRIIHIRATLTKDKNGKDIINGTKTKAGVRNIPINDHIRGILKDRQALSEMLAPIRIDDFVFKSSLNRAYSMYTINKEIIATLASLEKKGIHIDHFSAHAFRDTFATRAIESGMNPKTLQAILGHENYATTMDIYAHVLEDTMRSEMDVLGKAMAK